MYLDVLEVLCFRQLAEIQNPEIMFQQIELRHVSATLTDSQRWTGRGEPVLRP
jgi:hypothetical protein